MTLSFLDMIHEFFNTLLNHFMHAQIHFNYKPEKY